MKLCSATLNVNFFDNVLIGAIFVVLIALFVCAIVASCARASIFWRYWKYNRKTSSINMSGENAARQLLAFKGITDVDVKKAGIFRALFYGNSYSPNKKTIYLRKGIIDKNSITAVILAIQKVGLAEQHHSGDKKYSVYAKLVPYCPFIGIFFVPMILVGIILDVIFFNFSGIISLTVAIIGVILYIGAFILVILNVPVEKKATVIALNTMKESGAFSEDEINIAKKIYKSYITQYVTDMIIAILQIIKFILQVILSTRQQNK